MQINKLRASAIAWILLVPLFMGLILITDVDATPTPVLDEISWMKGAIDSHSDVSNIVSQAIDGDGHIHVSYYNSDTNRLMYATNSNGVWRSQVVDSTTSAGKYNSIAVDGDGVVHISYSNDANNDLKYASGNFDSWTLTTVDSATAVGDFNSIACHDKKVFISYYNYSGQSLKLAVKTAGRWSTTTIVEDVSQGSTMAMKDGKVYIAYLSSNFKLKMAIGNGTGWVVQDVDSTSAFSKYLAIDILNGYPCVVYYSTISQDLKIATTSGTAWDTQVVDDVTSVAYGVSVNVDSLQRIHIVYSDAALDLRYAIYNGTWNYFILDASVGNFKSIVSDVNDKQHVVYIDREPTYYQLGYLTNSGAKWLIKDIDSSGGADKFSSIAVDAMGFAHIAFYDTYVDNNVTKGRLCHATSANGWQVETVDISASAVPNHPSVVVDSHGFVHISYWDAAIGGTLKYATNADGPWKNNTLDALGNIGKSTSIAVDSTGTVHIVYTYHTPNPANNVLKYANFSSEAGLNTGSIETGVVTNGQVALVADSEDHLHVAYYKEGELHYAIKSGATWGDAESVDTSDQLGGGISMYVNAAGNVFITYYDNGLSKLMYVNNTGGSWVSQDIALAAGGASAIFVDEEGDEHISYLETNTPNGILKYKERRNGIWMDQNIDLTGCSPQISMAMDSLGRGHVSYFDPSTKVLKYATSIMAPSAPTNLTIDVESNKLTLNWAAPKVDGGSSIIEYRIFRSVAGGEYLFLDAVLAPGLAYIDDGLEDGVTYSYYIRAVNAEGTGELSEFVSGIPCREPQAPVLKASGQDKAVKLTWNEPENGGADITGYKIYRKNATGVFELLVELGGNTRSYTDKQLENGQEYSYYIKAFNPAGPSVDSAVASATPEESNTLMIIAIVIIVLAAVGVGAFVFLKKSGRI